MSNDSEKDDGRKAELIAAGLTGFILFLFLIVVLSR
ncbi:hypothetical protein J2T57_003000 [Natronocella acetinitrilica]|jgi:hypothetical protein|uniref:Uncharacterized protein n=1 Tax=Natronocella acetinitrilica TaxID=414046 RepID=A0AAE3KBN6_9GAMM|nr:hypothetical protein [Natronocella acetinitrilica]